MIVLSGPVCGTELGLADLDMSDLEIWIMGSYCRSRSDDWSCIILWSGVSRCERWIKWSGK